VTRPAGSGDRSVSDATVRRLGGNALALLGAYAVPRLLVLASVIAAARELGAAAFGAYGTAAAFAVVLSILATLGMQPLLVRDLARSPEHAAARLAAAHVVKTGSAVLMLGTLLVAARVLDLPGDVTRAALLLGIGYAVGGYVENLAAYVQARERMHLWTEASAVYGLVTGASGAALVIGTGSVAWFCAAPILGQLATLGWLLRRMPPPAGAGRVRGADVAALVRALAPFAAAFIALTVHSKLDILLLAQWRGAVEVGLYAAAAKLVDVTQALVVVAVAAVHPTLARAAAGPAATRWAATRVLELTLLAAVPAAGLVFLVRGGLMAVVFGAEYADAVRPAAWLAAALPALAVNITGGYVLGTKGRMRDVAALYGGALSLKALLCTLWVPALGAAGAARAMLAAELVLSVGMLRALHVHAAAAPDRRAAALASGAAIAAGGCAWAAGAADTAVATVAFVTVVLALYALGGALPHGERASIVNSLRPRRGAGGIGSA
jgi:O-antigen/teichoic acid export membrane protein